jgi:7-cyano-7-deazaguanine synthase
MNDDTDQFRSSTALVLFSGGQDSATCLAWALARFARVETLGFDYGQRHVIELACRDRLSDGVRLLRADWAQKLGDNHTLVIPTLSEISETALTRDVAIEMGADGLPNTFVPGRNLVFLTFAAALAYRRGISDIVGGMCETDYSGYPDCRNETICALQQALTLGMAKPFELHTPLMWLSKAATWQLAHDLGGTGLVDLIREHSHTCYLGERGVRHDWGFGCGECPACSLRAKGWREYVGGLKEKRAPASRLRAREGAAMNDQTSLDAQVLDAVADALICADRSGAITRWNRAAEHLFGYSADEALGQNLDLIIPEHLRAAHWNGFNAAITSGTMKLQGRPTLTRAQHKSGGKLYIEMTFALVKGAEGEVRGSVAMARDVTERERAARRQ